MARRKNPTRIGENHIQTDNKFAPPLSDEAREVQLVNLAYDLAEQRLRDGTASAQEVTHFLKMGSQKERQEMELLRKQIALVTAKAKALETAENVEKLYADAIESMRTYSGKGGE